MAERVESFSAGTGQLFQFRLFKASRLRDESRTNYCLSSGNFEEQI